MSAVSLLSGPVTRTWRVGTRLHPVQLYHNTLTGQRWLTCDGIEVPGTVGTFYGPLSSKAVLSFEVDGSKGQVTIESAGSRIFYRCFFTGHADTAVTSSSSASSGTAAMIEILEDNLIASVGAASAASSASGDESSGKLRVTVDAAEFAIDGEAGKEVIWFKVHATREGTGVDTVVHRRFNNFVALDEAVRSAYKGSHILQALPSLPPRGIKFLENQNDIAFIEKRKWYLQDYLYKLEQIPRMRRNMDFLTFLGLIDETRESSVLFPPGPLGLTLTSVGEFTEVTGMKPLADGRPGAAMASGYIHVGDKVSKVNGEDVLDKHYDVILAMIKSSLRPMIIHFLGDVKNASVHTTNNNNSNYNSTTSSSSSAAAAAFIVAPTPVAFASFAAPTAPSPAPASGAGDGGLFGSTDAAAPEAAATSTVSSGFTDLI